VDPNANLVNSGANSVVASNTVDNAVHQSKSYTYLTPNGDGTYGLVTETHQILAPVTLLGGTLGLPAVTVETAGEWVLRTTATGKTGGAKVEYAPVGSVTPTTKVIVVKLAGAEIASLTTQQLLTGQGLVVPIPGVGEIAIGEDPRAIGGDAASKPEVAGNGTVAAAAVDVARVTTLPLAAALGVDIADLRIGHMESRAQVPAGGIQCGIPVNKVGNPTSVVAGEDKVITYTVTIPADIEDFKAVACDLVNVKVVDVTTASEGVKFDIVSASNNGTISGNKVSWDLGTYKPGADPIVLTVGLKVPYDSAAGKITDTATATAVLGNCKGNASANSDSLAGLAKFDAAALTGSAVFSSEATAGGSALGAGEGALAGAGPEPVGGVGTGAGGSSQGNSLLIGTALGCVALAGYLARRRRNG